MRLRIDIENKARIFTVLQIDMNMRCVLGFIGREDIAIWHSFDGFSDAQIDRLETAYKKNGKNYRY